MAASIIDQFDYKGQKQNFKRDAFDTIFEMANFSENYLPPIFEAFCYETGLKYRYNISNPNDPVLKKWRVVADGSGDLPTASATVKGGAKIGTSLEIKNEVLDVKVPTDENFTTELKEKLEDIDMDTKVDVEEGKGLSTNDLTDELKEQYDKAQQNVQSDWNQADDTKDDFIKNKPSKLSDFTNDPEFIDKTVENLENYYLKTQTYTKLEIEALLAAINEFNVYIVDDFPTEDIDDHAIYFVPKVGATTDFYEQYIYIEATWRKIGDTQISLADYYTKLEADELLDDKQDVLEFDDTPTEDSDNPVTSDGVKTYVDAEVGKKLDKSFGEDNKNKTLVTDENGDVVLLDVASLPEPEAKDKVFLSVENEETSELEWTQIDRSEIDGSAYVNLDIGSDLNTLVTHGTFRVTTKRVDRIENVPVQIAGMLTVRLTGSVIYQTYRTVNNEMYTRTSEDAGENWCEWINVGASSDVEDIYINKFASKNIFKPMGLCNISSTDATVVPAQSAYGYCAEVDTTKSYTISFEGEGTCAYAFFAKYPEIGDVAIGGVRYNIEGLSAVIKSADFPEGTKYVMIRTADTVSKVQLEIGETATPYVPFLKSNKMLTEEFDNLKKESINRVALTELKMLGWCVPKEFDGIKNEVVDGKFIQKIGRVNLGTLNWFTQEVADHERFCVGSGSKEGIPDITPSTMNIYCVLYKADSAGNTYNHKTDKTISIDGNKGVRVYDSSFDVHTQLSDFVDFIQDVYMYYELETPIEIPIDGNEIILKKSGLPEAEAKNKILVSVENTEGNIEWKQTTLNTMATETEPTVPSLEFIKFNTYSLGLPEEDLVEGQDLNELTTRNRKYKTTSAIASTLLHCPVTTTGFRLTVYSMSVTSYVTQIIETADDRYIRYWNKSKNKWYDWKKFLTDADEVGGVPFKGTHDEWDALTDEEKARYEIVIFTDDYANAVEKYSTEEVKTNKVWIDGKPIYRKVIVSNSRGDAVFATNVDTLVNVYGQFTIPSMNGVSIPFGSTSYYFTAVVNNSSEAVLYTNYGSYTGYKIVIEYTKTN